MNLKIDDEDNQIEPEQLKNIHEYLHLQSLGHYCFSFRRISVYFVAFTLACAGTAVPAYIGLYEFIPQHLKFEVLDHLLTVLVSVLCAAVSYISIDEICDRTDIERAYNRLPEHIKSIPNFPKPNRNQGLSGNKAMYILYYCFVAGGVTFLVNGVQGLISVMRQIIDWSIYT